VWSDGHLFFPTHSAFLHDGACAFRFYVPPALTKKDGAMRDTAMITARDYYENVAKATVVEFQKNNGDRRLALLASMAVLHVVDYVMQNREPDPKKAEDAVHQYTYTTSENNFAFLVVKEFALASKHCRLRNNRLHSGEHVTAYPSFTGVMRAGQLFLGDKIGGITIHWKDQQWVNLTNALQNVLELFEADFPELTTDKSDTE
jgi:hypothetical protein